MAAIARGRAVRIAVLLFSFAIVVGVSRDASAQVAAQVAVCHVPPGNPKNAHFITIASEAVPAHLGHGDVAPLPAACSAGVGECRVDALLICTDSGPVCNATPQPAPEEHEVSCGDAKDNDCDGAIDDADSDCQVSCQGGVFTVTVGSSGALDETTWTLTDSNPEVIAEGGPYSAGTINSTAVVSEDVPLEFAIETEGFFKDNIANYSVECNGVFVVAGALTGGQSTTVGNICCPGVVP